MRRLSFNAVLAVSALSAISLFGHGIIPGYVPVARLVANLTRYIEENPADPDGYYRLGRVHTMALETRLESVIAYDSFPEPSAPAAPAEGYWAKPRQPAGEKPVSSTPAEARTHLAEAIRLLNKAIELRPDAARYRLTLASALEAGRPIMDEVDVWPLVPVEAVLHPTPITARTIAGDTEWIRSVGFDSKGPMDLDEMIRNMRGSALFHDMLVTFAYQLRDKPEFRDKIKRVRATDWSDQIENQYFAAMSLALPEDGKASTKPIWGGMENWASYEAGKAFIRVVETRPARPSDSIRLRTARETIKAFDDLPPPRAITPIVLDFAGKSLADLLSSKTSAFDLDGSDRPMRWSWLKPDAGILVWDPERGGHITSGRQLFGSVTFWLFFADGYQALDALDDNRDGALRSTELQGLSVWFDRNENGVSDAGEVTPVEELGIDWISCRATAEEDGAPVNAHGFHLSDGRTLPTYDWIATAAPVVPRSE